VSKPQISRRAVLAGKNLKTLDPACAFFPNFSRSLVTNMKICRILLLGFAPLLLPAVASANTWNSTIGSWFVAGNWTAPAAVPTAADPVLINNGGTAQVQAPGAVASTCTVGSGGPGTLTISGNGELIVSLTSWIGDTAGTLNVTGPAARFVSTGEGHIGSFGAGTLNVDSGGSANFPDAAFVGEIAGANGAINVSGAGSTLNAHGMIIGDEGRGALLISAGGVANLDPASSLVLGQNASGVGTIQLSGLGSRLSSPGSDVRVGVFGQGGLAVNDGALVEATGHAVILAENAGSSAELIVGAMNTPAGLIHANYIVAMTANAIVTFAHSTVGYDLSPPIHGPLRVQQTGFGSTHFYAANTYSGGTLISNGTLATGHSDALGSGPVTNNARLALEGNLSLFGAYVQGAGGTLDTAFAGPGCLPASMSVAQAVTLAGTLSLRLPGCTPTAGQTYLILSSGASIAGIFSGLPDGAVFTFDGQRFRIHYTATQVTLDALGAAGAPAQSIPTLTPLGLGLLVGVLALAFYFGQRWRRM